MTTTNNTSRLDIIALRDDAARMGDADTVRLCTIALGLDPYTERHETIRSAWADCCDKIAHRRGRAA